MTENNPQAKSACCGVVIKFALCSKCGRPAALETKKPHPVSEEEMEIRKTLQRFITVLAQLGAEDIAKTMVDWFGDVSSRLSQKEEECRRLRSVLKELPDKLRASLSGHKGEAYRIAFQICDEALSHSSL